MVEYVCVEKVGVCASKSSPSTPALLAFVCACVCLLFDTLFPSVAFQMTTEVEEEGVARSWKGPMEEGGKETVRELEESLRKKAADVVHGRGRAEKNPSDTTAGPPSRTLEESQAMSNTLAAKTWFWRLKTFDCGDLGSGVIAYLHYLKHLGVFLLLSSALSIPMAIMNFSGDNFRGEGIIMNTSLINSGSKTAVWEDPKCSPPWAFNCGTLFNALPFFGTACSPDCSNQWSHLFSLWLSPFNITASGGTCTETVLDGVQTVSVECPPGRYGGSCSSGTPASFKYGMFAMLMIGLQLLVWPWAYRSRTKLESKFNR